MAPNSDSSPSNPFARINEYTTLLADSASISDRRQSTNEVLIGFNLAILTAVGFLLVSARFHNWVLPGVLLLICLVITPINWAWRRTLTFYQKLIAFRIGYIEEIEAEFRARSGQEDIGLFTRLKRAFYTDTKHTGTTHTERRIAVIFIILFPMLTLLVSALTALETLNLIPQLLLQ